jgi:hypothetical protein
VDSVKNGTDQRGGKMLQHQAFQFVIARDHVDLLRRDARQARLAKARRQHTRSGRRSR